MKYEKPEARFAGSPASCIQGQWKGAGGPVDCIVVPFIWHFSLFAYEADE